MADLEKLADAGDEFCDTVGTSRDYLAKLLFWFVGNHWPLFYLLVYIHFNSGNFLPWLNLSGLVQTKNFEARLQRKCY